MTKLKFLDLPGLSDVVDWFKVHTSNNDIHTSIEEKSKFKEAYNHSASLHAPTDAEKNIIVGVKKNGEDVLIDEESRTVNITDTWKPNTIDSEGYVPKGEGQTNKIWGTDADGNPKWIDQNDMTAFCIDFSIDENGNLIYDSGLSVIFNIDDNGNLLWEVM